VSDPTRETTDADPESMATGPGDASAGTTQARTEAGTGTTRRSDARTLAGVYLKGAAMGAADTVPGVSGGTIALVTGVYERLIDALTSLDPRVLGHLRRLHRTEGRRSLRDALLRMDVLFLIALGLGVLTSVLTLSRVVHVALVEFRAHTFAFFFGLIGASAVVLYRSLSLETVRQAGAGAAGFLVAFAVTGASSSGLLPTTLPVVFVAGAVGITAMVLPGISGAFILLLLGQYTYLTGVLTDLVDRTLALVAGGSTAGLVASATTVTAFVAGAAVGLLTVAHVIRRALDRYRTATLVFLVSLMLGSLRLPVAEVLDGVSAWTPAATAGIGGVALVGAVAVLGLDRYTDDLDY
jgi:putative membrane protein